jgi:hypothetical protein
MNDHPIKDYALPEHADVKLIALGERLKLAWAAEREVVATAPDTRAGDALIAVATKGTGTIVQKIEVLQATTIDGLKVTVLALGWARGGKLDPPYFSDESTTDVRLIDSIALAVTAM